MIDYNAISNALKEFWLKLLADVPNSQKISDKMTQLMLQFLRRWIEKMNKEQYNIAKFTTELEKHLSLDEKIKEVIDKIDKGEDVSDDLNEMMNLEVEDTKDREEEENERDETAEGKTEETETSEEMQLPEENDEEDEEGLEFTANLMTVTKFYRVDTGELVDWSEEVLREVKSNFDESVVHFDIPVNIEHEKKWGVIGKVTGLDLKDGKLYATIKLTPGYEWVKDSFKYLSAEICDEWIHPFTGKKYHNVLVGVAVTNYPAGIVEQFNVDELLGKAVKYNVPPLVVGEFKKMLTVRKFSPQGRKILLEVFSEIIKAYKMKNKVENYDVEVRPSVLDINSYVKMLRRKIEGGK